MTPHDEGGPSPSAHRPRSWAGCRFQWADRFVGDGRDCRVVIATADGLLRWVYEDAAAREDGGWVSGDTLADHVAHGRVVVTWVPPATTGEDAASAGQP